MPYTKLSDYNFFDGNLKDQNPSLNVLEYEPASSLFTDYAHKKRFVWMPDGTTSNFNGDENTLELPVGAALIKTFYYENVQNISPVGGTRIIETRIMIRKSSGWIFADYIWNEDQTEAFYNLDGSFTEISWKDENNVIKSTSYRIPNEVQCIICHKTNKVINGVPTTLNIPIGIKPQNLNFIKQYGNKSVNQLTKWIEEGYLNDNFSLPSSENSTIDYTDTSKPLALRARSYVDINCAHCHQTNSHCDYRPMRFSFKESGMPAGKGNSNMGVCVDTQDMQDFPSALSSIVKPGNVDRSMLYYRINTDNENFRMPLHGRTIIHEEGVALMEQWINSIQDCP